LTGIALAAFATFVTAQLVGMLMAVALVIACEIKCFTNRLDELSVKHQSSLCTPVFGSEF
jgi:hypothetical protein